MGRKIVSKVVEQMKVIFYPIIVRINLSATEDFRTQPQGYYSEIHCNRDFQNSVPGLCSEISGTLPFIVMLLLQSGMNKNII